MADVSRRQFLSDLLGAACFLAAGGTGMFGRVGENTDFDIVVVGDSFIWGQGLRERDKFYSIVREWLEREVFEGSRRVRMTVKAHSGARITIHEKQLAKMRKVGQDPEKFYYPEADISFPSITHQVTAAARETGNPDTVRLVMLSGGITDLVVGNAVNPFLRENKMREMIHRYSHKAMTGLLDHIAATFPNALTVVVGYFPIVSTRSDVNKLTKYLMKIVRFPHPLQFLLTNIFSKQFMKIVRKATSERSRIWVFESNKELRDAVRDANVRTGRERAIFVESPIGEANCFATKEPYLFGMDEDNLPEDPLYRERKVECPKVFREIKYKPFGFVSVRLCELASVAHPNEAGSRAYAEAIKSSLISRIGNRG